MEVLSAFFEGYTAQELVIYFVMVVVFLIPGIGPAALNWAKVKLKLSGGRAYYLIVGVLMLVSLMALYITGGLQGVGFKLKEWLGVAGICLALAQDGYRRLMGKNKKVEGS